MADKKPSNATDKKGGRGKTKGNVNPKPQNIKRPSKPSTPPPGKKGTA